MYNNDVGKEGVRVYEAYEVKQRVAFVRVPFYFINLLPTLLLYISILLKYLDLPMSEMQELSLAHSFVTHNFPVTLSAHYNPAGMPNPKGDMVVVAVKAQRQTRDKATVWVEFLSPPSHAGKQIQLYPKSLEPKNGPAQVADFSLLTALRTKFPHATTWRNLGVTPLLNSRTTSSALAALALYSGGERFTADKLANSALETS